MKKFISLLMAVILMFGMTALVGCGGSDIDPNRTQLYVGLKESGLGREWLDDLIVEYEKQYPDIQVILDVKNEEYDSQKVLANIKHGREDVYLLNTIKYYDFVSIKGGSDYLVELTDIITDGGEKSLWNRGTPKTKEYYNVGTETEPEIYTIPFSESVWCITYDKELFRNKDLYDLDSYKGFDGVSGTGDESFGPDGVEGTYDDGLPATWEDFKILLNEMVSLGITPFTWTGKWSDYRASIISAILASYEGENDYMLRYEFNGTHSSLGEINEQNGYKLADAEGVKAALTVAKHITSNPQFYSSKTTNTTLDHSQAQLEYLKSKETDQPIAFLLEATWWEYEAKGVFEEMRAKYGEGNGYGERELGLFPMPRFIGTPGIKDQTNTKTTFTGTISSAGGGIIINKNSDVVDIAKTFVRFITTEEAQTYYTSVTGNSVPYKLDISEDKIANLTSLQKDIIRAKKSGYAEFIGKAVKNNLMLYSGAFFESWKLKARIDGTTHNDPLLAFQKNPDLTVEQYINGIKEIYNANTWTEMYSRVYN